MKFVNNLLSQAGLEAPFPFSPVIAESLAITALNGSGGSELHSLEQAVSTLISLLNSKQVMRGGLDGRRSQSILCCLVGCRERLRSGPRQRTVSES